MNAGDKLLRIIRESAVKQVIYRGRKYHYIYNPISTGIYPIEPDILRFIVDTIRDKIKPDDIDYILTYEAMGIHIATALSLLINKPFIIARKKKYMDDMIEISRETDSLYIPSEVTGKRIIIVDSIISTGRTILETIKTLGKYDVDICGVYVVIERMDQGGGENIYRETGIKIWSMVKIDVKNDKIVVIETNI